MKLLVIASLTQFCTANYLIRAFRHSGHEVLVCSDAAGAEADVRAGGLVDVPLVLQRTRFAAEAVIFVEGGSMRLLPDTSFVPDIPCVWYAIDTHMDFEKHVRLGRLFDATFVAQKQYLKALSERGIVRVEWIPLAFAPETSPTETLPAVDLIVRDIDVAYVGSMNGAVHTRRVEMLKELEKQGWRTAFGGATPAEMGQLYARSKIVFNLSINNDINMRFFEAMGAGAVLLTDRIVDNGVDDLFRDGTHYVSYGSMEELVRTTRGLLANPSRIREIGEAARRLVLASHTYRHRADAMIASLNGSAKAPRPEASDVFSACLALGLSADAMAVAGRAIATIGGGRYSRTLGRAVAPCLRLMAAGLRGAEGLRMMAAGRRHG